MRKIGQGVMVGLAVVMGAQWLWAEQRPSDPIGDQLFPPELLLQQQQALGLSEQQVNATKAAIQSAQEQFKSLQSHMQQEINAFGVMLGQSPIDETKALAELDKLLDVERAMKHTQMGLLITVKNVLTPEQQAKLKAIKQHSQTAGAPPESLQRKMQQIQARVPAWVQGGGDQATLAPLFQKLDGFLKASQFSEAEGVADHILTQIGG